MSAADRWSVDWHAWRAEWAARSRPLEAVRVRTGAVRSWFPAAAPFCADERLGEYGLPDGRRAELWEVVMPDLRGGSVRYVGVVFAKSPGGWCDLSEREVGPLCGSWAEVAEALGLDAVGVAR